MYEETFASHLGFDTWAHLVNASEPVAVVGFACTWYIVMTNTWYKWVLWDTNYDMLYNHRTRQEALNALESHLKTHSSQCCQWFGVERLSIDGFGDVG